MIPKHVVEKVSHLEDYGHQKLDLFEARFKQMTHETPLFTDSARNNYKRGHQQGQMMALIELRNVMASLLNDDAEVGEDGVFKMSLEYSERITKLLSDLKPVNSPRPRNAAEQIGIRAGVFEVAGQIQEIMDWSMYRVQFVTDPELTGINPADPLVTMRDYMEAMREILRKENKPWLPRLT